MPGIGTIINIAFVIAGGLIGLIFGKFISERYQKILYSALGMSVLFIGVAGVLSEMLVINDGQIETQGTFMMIISLVSGAIIGELVGIDRLINKFAFYLKIKTKSESDNSFINGFVTTSVTICIGAMAIVGPINDVLYGDISVLLAKSMLDGVLVMIMAASMGKGCIFSAIPLAAVQGFFTLVAKLIQPVLTSAALSNISLVGSVLIFAVGVNLTWDYRIKVSNLLPSIIFAALLAFIM